MPLHPKHDPTESCPRKTDKKGETGEMLRAQEHLLPLQRPWHALVHPPLGSKTLFWPSQTPTLTHTHITLKMK